MVRKRRKLDTLYMSVDHDPFPFFVSDVILHVSSSYISPHHDLYSFTLSLSLSLTEDFSLLFLSPMILRKGGFLIKNDSTSVGKGRHALEHIMRIAFRSKNQERLISIFQLLSYTYMANYILISFS